MTSLLRLTLLGGCSIRLNDQPLPNLTSRKAQALLCYLAVTGRAHTRSALAGLLWPEVPEANARMNLRKELTRLRRVVAPYLQVSRETIAFDRRAPYWLDVEQFERLVQGPGDRARWAEAVGLYQGDFLAGLEVLNAPPFEDWVRLERTRLREQWLQALQRLATNYERHGDLEPAIDYIRRLLALEPWREEGQRQLMRLYAQNSQRGEALAQYETCRQVLADELGVEPSAETVALYERIRDGALSKSAAKPVSREALTPALLPPSTPAPLHNLPAQTTPFVGRERELADLARLLDQPNNRLVTIFAPGGMGKSRLALETAAAQVERFHNGVYRVRLAPLSDLETMISAIAEAVGYPFQADKRSPRQQLLDYFREKELLLLLDNFEHLLAGVDLVTAILQAAPGVRVLVTSRERLKLSGETVFSLEGLDYPEHETRPGSDYSAVKLFIQSAQRVQPAFAPQGDDLEAIARICRLVAGMPLGILLAASWAEMLTPGEIAVEIEGSFDFLEADLRDLPERQRSLRAVFAQTWRRLAQAERQAFMRLSVFRGGFTREAAQTVTGASLRTLAALVNKALLQGDPGGRYEIHELVRQYAEEQLEASGQREAAREAHGAYYLDFLGQREADLKGKRQLKACAEIEAGHENVYIAWRWAVKHGRLDRLDQAMESLGLFYHWHLRFQDGETAFRLATEKLTTTVSEEEQSVLAKVLTWQSHFSRELGQIDLATELLQQSSALLDSPLLADQETRPERATVLRELGFLTLGYDREEAQRLFEESVALCRAVGDQWGVAASLNALGWMIRQMGDYKRAQQLHEECLAICQPLGYHWHVLAALDSLAFGALAQTQLEEAERLAWRALAIRQEIGYRTGIARGRRNLGVTLTLLGKFAAGYEQLTESEAIYLDFGIQYGLLFLKTWLGFAELHLEAYQKARQHSQEGLALGREAGHQGVMGNALFVLGCLAWVEGRYIQAHQWLQESAAIYQTLKQWHERGVALAALGHVEGKLGNRSGARQALAQALQTGETRALHPLLLALSAIALLLVDQGETERGVELYALASRYLYVANSRWYEDVAGQHITAVAKTLPPEVVAAAQERGKARDLWQTAEELLKELEQE